MARSSLWLAARGETEAGIGSDTRLALGRAELMKAGIAGAVGVGSNSNGKRLPDIRRGMRGAGQVR
jgi:hypothetical protein